ADDLAGRLLAVTRAFRRWSLDHPAEFAMIFGSPVPTYRRPTKDHVPDAGNRFGGIFFMLFSELWRRHPFPVPAEEDIPAPLRRELRHFAISCATDEADIPLGLIRMFAACWIRLYGLVTMEVFGHMEFMMDDGEPLFEAELADIARSMGLY